MIAEESEFRSFSDEFASTSASKKRTSSVYNDFDNHVEIGFDKQTQIEKEFLWSSLRCIKQAFASLYGGENTNKPAEERAVRLFKIAFDYQWKQKQGDVKSFQGHMTVGKAIKKNTTTDVLKRSNFSRRKQFIVACIWFALKEQNVNVSIAEISSLVEGQRVVSQKMVNRCLKDIGVY